MANETNIVVDENPTPEIDTTADYIAAIEELKANTVSKKDYEKVVNDNKELLKTLVNGGQVTPQTEKPVDINGLRKELFSDNSNLSNLEFWTKTLELRDALIARDGIDPFVPHGHKIAPTAEDAATANKVANVIRKCIKEADGDSRFFTNELNRLTVDIAPARRRR